MPTFNLTMASCWRFTERTVGPGNWAGTDPQRFPPPLPKPVGVFIINIFLVIKMLSKLKSGKCWTRLASYPLQYGNWPWWNNPAICKASSEENGTGQYPELYGKGTLGPELKSTKIPWNFQFRMHFKALRRFGFFIALPHTVSNQRM